MIKTIFSRPIQSVLACTLRPDDYIHDAAHRNLVGLVETVASDEKEKIWIKACGDESTRELKRSQYVIVTRGLPAKD